MFIDRMIKATSRMKEMCREQRLKNFKRNAEILTELKYGKRKKKVPGKYSGELVIPRSPSESSVINKNLYIRGTL